MCTLTLIIRVFHSEAWGKMALINSKLAVTIVMVIGVTGLFLTLLASGVLISTKTITSSGTVVSVNVGIYLDNACQQTVTWNREGATLTANQVAAATLTLSVSPSISGVTTFSFDVIITGTG